MRGTSCAEVETFTTTALLPPDALLLMGESAGIFAARAWWEVVQAHATPAGAVASFVAIRSAGQIVALLPMLQTGKRLSSLTTPYTCEYAPLFTAGLDRATEVAAMATFGAFCRSLGVVRLDALPAEWAGLANLAVGMRQAGLRALPFDHFGNWYEDVDGLDWATYLKRRAGELRATIRRRLRRAEKLPDARFELFTQPAQMDAATQAFESVYRRSWKTPEPFPTFNAAAMRAMAARGVLRFGVWSIAAEPVAVQVWVVHDRHATVLKLAHDEAFKAHSPGTVLTALVLRHLLDQEHVARIDFGRGDDVYKRGWATQRRQRIGLLLVNPWRWSGMAALARHAVARVRSAAPAPNIPVDASISSRAAAD
jgi:CelD/BcsL family acetyltransferase involved in cellulose biosynthesis